MSFALPAALRSPAAAVLAAALLAGGPAAAQEPVSVDVELVLAVDVSGSVDAHEGRLQRDGYVAALRSKELVEAVKAGILGRIAVTYFEWAGDAYQLPVVDWAIIQDKASADAFADRLAAAPIATGPWTSISGAIRHAIPRFGENDYQGTRRVIDISGDGPNNSGEPVTLARDAAVEAGLIVNGLPIVNDRPQPFGAPQVPDLDKYYADCVIGGPGAFIVVAKDFGDFARAIRRKLLFEISGVAPPGDARPSLRIPVGYALGCDVGERRLRERRRRAYDEF